MSTMTGSMILIARYVGAENAADARRILAE